MAIDSFSTAFTRRLPPEKQCWTSLPLRVNNHENIATEASIRFLQQWKEYKLPVVPTDYQYQLSQFDYGHLVTMFIPDAKPGRIAGVTKMIDLILAADDIIDSQDSDGAIAAASSLSIAETSGSPTKGLTQLLEAISQEIINEDPILGMRMVGAVMDYWKTMKASGEKPDKIPDVFSEFFPFRYCDFAAPIAFEVLSYALDVELTQEEREALQFLEFVANTIQILWNDMYSWPKEYLQYQQNPLGVPPLNSVLVLMAEYGCNSEEALKMCRKKTLQYEAKCHQLTEEFLNDRTMPAKVILMANAYRSVASGTALWSCASLRNQSTSPESRVLSQVVSLPLPSIEVGKDFDIECERLFRKCAALVHQQWKGQWKG